MRVCRRSAMVFVVAAILVGTVLSGAAPRACTVPPDLVARVATATGGVVAGKNYFGFVGFSHPATDEFMLECGLAKYNIYALRDVGHPSDDFFEVVAKAGAVIAGVSPKLVEKGLRACRSEALAGDEHGNVTQDGVHIECQAFLRAGGGTVMFVWKGDEEDADAEDDKPDSDAP